MKKLSKKRKKSNKIEKNRKYIENARLRINMSWNNSKWEKIVLSNFVNEKFLTNMENGCKILKKIGGENYKKNNSTRMGTNR